MKKVVITFNGTLSELTAFLNEHFDNPESLMLTVGGEVRMGKALYDGLIKKAVAFFSGSSSTSPWVETLREQIPHLLELVRTNQKIAAIKALRNITNCGLKEGKDYVEGPLADFLRAP